MAKLIYSMPTSLDGYTEDGHGKFGWGAPEDEEVHSYVKAVRRPRLIERVVMLGGACRERYRERYRKR